MRIVTAVRRTSEGQTYELTGPEATTFHDVASQVPGVTWPAGSVRAGP